MRPWICVLVCACGGGESPAGNVPITEIRIEPSTKPMPGPTCADVTVHVATDRVTIGRGTPATIPHANGAIDTAAVEARLRVLAVTCSGAAVVDGDDAVTYQDLISVMDLALQAGLLDVQLAVDVHIETPRERAKRSDALLTAPVVVVSATDVQVNQAVVAPISADVTAPVATALADRTPKGMMILQADASIPLRTIKQVIAGGRKAGFPSCLFAVKRT